MEGIPKGPGDVNREWINICGYDEHVAGFHESQGRSKIVLQTTQKRSPGQLVQAWGGCYLGNGDGMRGREWRRQGPEWTRSDRDTMDVGPWGGATQIMQESKATGDFPPAKFEYMPLRCDETYLLGVTPWQAATLTSLRVCDFTGRIVA